MFFRAKIAMTACFIPHIQTNPTASAHLFVRIRNRRAPLFKRPSLYWKTLGHGPILAPLTFRPRRLHKYYNPAAPWLVALNQINMQARTTKEIQLS